MPNGPCDMIVPGGFSPNGDGINDEWVVALPDCSDSAPVLKSFDVYNRWGHLVWQPEIEITEGSVAKLVSWDGKSNQGVRFGGDTVVPSGTYFYSIQLNDGEAPLIGYITIGK